MGRFALFVITLCQITLYLSLSPSGVATASGDLDTVPGNAAPGTALHQFARSAQCRHTLGVYLAGVKIGWVVEEYRIERHGKDEILVRSSECLMRTLTMGETSEYRMDSKIFYSLKDDGAILLISESETEDGQTTRRSATPIGDKLEINTKDPSGEVISRQVPIPLSRLETQRQLQNWLRAERSSGDELRQPAIDLTKEDIDVEHHYTYQSKSSILWNRAVTEAYQLEVIDHAGTKSRALFRSNGIPLKGNIAILELRLEPEDRAKDLGKAQVDMMIEMAIRVETDLKSSEGVSHMELRLSGLQGVELPTSPRQEVRKQNDGKLELILRRSPKPAAPAPLDATDRAKYLRATPSVQCDDKRIINLSTRLTRKKADALAKATTLSKWVYDNLDGTYSNNASTALQVLKNRAGDCSEHALLMVALARAAKIPAREVSGLMFINEGTPIFGWHAWTEIHDGERWITVDPAWNQVSVDATHIKFTDDRDDYRWVNAIGTLKIEVMNYKRDRAK